MRQILISFIMIFFSFVSSIAQKQNVSNYIKELKYPAENLPEKVFFIPVHYGCDDCNNKMISYYKKNTINKNILFVFVTSSNKLMKIYINKHVENNFDMTRSANTILDVTNIAKKYNLVDAFPRLYAKKNNYDGIELDNNNMSILLK